MSKIKDIKITKIKKIKIGKIKMPKIKVPKTHLEKTKIRFKKNKIDGFKNLNTLNHKPAKIKMPKIGGRNKKLIWSLVGSISLTVALAGGAVGGYFLYEYLNEVDEDALVFDRTTLELDFDTDNFGWIKIKNFRNYQEGSVKPVLTDETQKYLVDIKGADGKITHFPEMHNELVFLQTNDRATIGVTVNAITLEGIKVSAQIKFIFK